MDGNSVTVAATDTTEPEQPIPVTLTLTGWKCPTCGGGVAPFIQRCPCTPPSPQWDDWWNTLY